jgi:LPXTG-motif cell wall-anchored protein
MSTIQGFGMGTLPIDNGGSGASRSAPGPVIGVGVPALIALGGYVWYRRRRREK